MVVGLGVGLGFYFSKRTPNKPADPAPVNISPSKPSEGAVTFGTSLPGGNGGGTAGGGGAPGGGAPSGGGSNQPLRKKGPIGAAS